MRIAVTIAHCQCCSRTRLPRVFFTLVDDEHNCCSGMRRKTTDDMNAQMSKLPTTLQELLTIPTGKIFSYISSDGYESLIFIGGVHRQCKKMKIPSTSPPFNAYNAFPLVAARFFVPLDGMMHTPVGCSADERDCCWLW